MSVLLAFAPSAAELAENTTFALTSAGPDVTPPMLGASGPIDGAYFYRQSNPAVTWTIPHGLGRYPTLTVQASIGDAALVEESASVTHLSNNELSIRFSEPAEGFAWLR